MNKEQNILFAKRNLVDSIWKSLNLEGFNTTYPDTYDIIEKAQLKDISSDEVLIANNLKLSWKLILDTIDTEIDVDFLKTLHSEVARGIALEWGVLRSGKVGVGGTSYIPPIPSEDTLTSLLSELNKIEDPLLRATTVAANLIKGQYFWDGNKRTAMLIANKILIENGCGLLSVPIEELSTFNSLLNRYYANDEQSEFISFLCERCHTLPVIALPDEVSS